MMFAKRMASIHLRKVLSLQRSNKMLNKDKQQPLSAYYEKVPPFIKGEYLTQHSFTVAGNTYEFRDGKFFLKMKYEINQGESFGEVALLKRTKRLATVKSELNCQFATLHYSNIKKSLAKIDDDYMTPKIHFLQNTQAFKGLSRRKTQYYLRLMEK